MPRFASSFLAVAALALAIAAPARAEPPAKVSIYGTEVVLPIPPGNCRLNEAVPADKEMLDMMRRINKGRNLVLAVFANCESLTAHRAKGAPLSITGSYLASLTAAKKRVSMPRSHFTKMMARILNNKKMQPKIQAAQDEAKKRVKNADVGGSLDGNQNLGVLHQDDDGAYLGLVQTWRTEGGPPAKFATIVGMTLVRQKAISMNLAADYEGTKTLDALLAQQRENIRRLIAAN